MGRRCADCVVLPVPEAPRELQVARRLLLAPLAGLAGALLLPVVLVPLVPRVAVGALVAGRPCWAA